MNINLLKQLVKKYLPSIIWGILIATTINLLFMRIAVPTGSMLPTIQLNDKLLVQRIYHPATLNRGDIVVFQSNIEEGDQLYIKRLIGLPGDTIEFKLIDEQSTVWINGELLDEPYVVFPSSDEISQVFQVPEDCFFFLGDNRDNSHDSRYWVNSYIHKSQIKGKMIFNFTQFINSFK